MRQNDRGAAELVREVERDVLAGRLRPGQKLPTVRQVAAERELSPATVASAYRTLRERGVVITEGRLGTRIADRPPLGPGTASAPVADGARNLADGNPSAAFLPDLGALTRRIHIEEPVLYGQVSSLAELEALAAADFEQDGIPAQQVAVTYGALDAIDLALCTNLALGDRVVVEDPCYPAVLTLVRSLGLRPIAAHVDDDGPLPEAVEAALRQDARAMILTPRAQNPFGSALSAARARELSKVLRGFPDVLVIEDDHAAKIVDAPSRTLTAGRASWLVVRSVTKSHGPDLRLAFSAGDPATVAQMQGRLAIGAGWVSTILQRVVLETLRDPHVAELAVAARSAYRERREALLAELGSRGLEAHGRSGFNVWIPVPDEAQAVAHLSAAGWAVAAGAPARLETGPAIRVTVAQLAPDEAPALADALARALKPAYTGRAA